MRIEFEIMGADVQFVTINQKGAEDTLEKLLDKSSFALLQDQEDIDVWSLMQGGKDDFYVFNADGTLSQFLPVSGEIDVNLSTDEGYENLKTAILAAE